MAERMWVVRTAYGVVRAKKGAKPKPRHNWSGVKLWAGIGMCYNGFRRMTGITLKQDQPVAISVRRLK